MKETWKTGLLILIALCLLITNVTGATYAIEDNFQNHPADSLSSYYENVDYTTPWTVTKSTGYGCVASVSLGSNPYSDTKALYIYADGFGSGPPTYHSGSGGVTSEKSEDAIKYLSFMALSASCSGIEREFKIVFYDNLDIEVDSTDHLGDNISNGDHVELLKSGDSIALYVNGAYIGNAGGTYVADLYSFYIYAYSIGSWHSCTLLLDDITVNNYIIGTIPQNWSIKRYWENPSANGLYNNTNTKIYTHDFHTSYTYRNITEYEPADSIVTRYAFTNEIVNTTTISQSADMITYNLTSMLFHDDQYDDQYGLYKQQLMQGTSILAEDFFWFDFESALKPSNNSTITFDDETYVADETMTLTWHLEDTDFSKYDFKGYLYNTDTWEQKETWIISSNDGSEEIETTSGYTEGNYLALLRAESKSTSWSTDLDWDVAKMLKETLVEGVTYDAESGSALGSVNVTFTQESTNYNATSEASTGAYNISGLAVGVSTDVNATKTNYIHNDFTFAPLIKGKYDMDLFLLPNADNINHSNASVGGLVLNYPFYQSVSDATVNLWKNSTWSTSTTTSNTGYYVFNDLPMNTTTITNETRNSSAYDSWVQLNYTNIVLNSEKVTNTTDETPFVLNTDYQMDYAGGKIKVLESGNMVNYTDYHIDYNYEVDTIFYINATKGGLYANSTTETITVSPKNYTYHYIILSHDYILTIYAKDVYSSTTITSFTAIVDAGTPQSTTTGVMNFTVDYGFHKVELSATGYTTVIDNEVYVDDDTEKTMYLTLIETAAEGGTGVYYPPSHRVEFRVQTWQGVPISDVYVTAQGYEITHPQSWLEKIFGYQNATDIYSEPMNGTTDSAGAIDFLMIETIKYKMTFTKGSTVNKTLYLFPKEDHYKILIGDASWVQTESMWDVVNYSVLVNDIPGNDTHSYINFSYIDLNSATTEIYYFINQTNGTTSFNIHNHTYTGGDCANVFNSQEVMRGEAYLIGFVGQNDDYGVIKYSIVVRIFEKAKRLLEFEDVPDYIYTYTSIGLLCLVGAFFGMVTVPEGSIVICLEAWILWFLGWFLWQNPLAPLYLTVATVFAILIIFTAKGRGKGVS